MLKAQTYMVVLCAALLAACGDDDGGDTDARVQVDAPIGSNPDAPESDVDAPEQAGTVEVQILAFNDFHGNLEPPAGNSGTVITGFDGDAGPIRVTAGGAGFFAHKVDMLRAENPNTAVVGAGDLIGASPLLSAAFHDEPTIEAMNLIGVNIMSVGNHEFDEGSSELLRMQFGGCHPVDGCQDGTPFTGADFQYLSANVIVDTNTGRTLLPKWDIREFEGVPMAFIGMTLEGTPSIVSPIGVAGLTFQDEVQTVNALIPELNTMGIHAITVVVHEGGSQPFGSLYDQCQNMSGAIVAIATDLDPDVDLIISGHTHQPYNCVIAGKRVTSAAAFGVLITQIELTLDKATKDVTEIDAHNVIVVRDEGTVEAVDDLVQGYLEKIAPIRDRIIGTLTAPLLRTTNPAGESVLGDVIADAQLAATAPTGLGGAVIAFMNPGGIRADFSHSGDITFGEMFTVQPFGNSMVTMTLTGAQIKAVLEQQFTPTLTRVLQVSTGLTYTWSTSAAVGSKVSAIELDGDPIDPAMPYRVTVNSFLATGGDGFTVLNQGTNRLGGAVDTDALEDYLVANNPLAPPADAQQRITVVP